MLVPIGDDNYNRTTTPIVTWSFIAINALVFIFFQGALGTRSGMEFTYGYSAVPYEITHGVDLVGPAPLAGGSSVERRSAAPNGEGSVPQFPGPSPIWLTLVSAMFMHGGWAHILGNMLYLWVFGDNIEDAFGHTKYIIFYLISGLAASFAQIAIDTDSVIPTLGASGAIAGVLGSYVVMFPHNRIRALLPLGFLWTTVELPAMVVLGLWIVLQLISQYTSSLSTGSGGVAYMAHIGGFAAGVVLTFFFRRSSKKPRFG
jgi:membrane associated rhomboid family serine protease